MMKLLAVALVALLLAGCGLHPDIIRQSWGGYFLFPGPLADAPRLPDFDFGGSAREVAGGLGEALLMGFLMFVGIPVLCLAGIIGGVIAYKRKKGVWKGVFVGSGFVLLSFLLLALLSASVVLFLLCLGGIVGAAFAYERKKGVWKGFFIGMGYGSLLVVLVKGGPVSYHYLEIAWEERGARKQVEKEAKILAKKIGLDDHRIILDAVDRDSLWLHPGYGTYQTREAPSGDYTGWVKMMNGNGQIEVLGQLKDGLFITIAVWKPNGEKCPATNVKKGNGVRVWYYDDGTESSRHTYKDGKVVSRTSRHSNGQKESEITYKDGQEDGLYTRWHENGQKKSEGNYKDGKVVSSTSYHSNGQKESEITYKDGKAVGTIFFEYYSNGQKKEEATYKAGKVISAKKWDKDGNPASKLVIITRTWNHKNASSDGPSPYAHIIGLDGSRSSLGPLDNIGVGDREAGSTDIYSLFFYYPVSKIQGIELVAKSNDAWRAKTISFQFFDDGKKSKPYVFEVNQWFSAEREKKSLGAIKSKMFSFRPELE